MRRSSTGGSFRPGGRTASELVKVDALLHYVIGHALLPIPLPG